MLFKLFKKTAKVLVAPLIGFKNALKWILNWIIDSIKALRKPSQTDKATQTEVSQTEKSTQTDTPNEAAVPAPVVTPPSPQERPSVPPPGSSGYVDPNPTTRPCYSGYVDPNPTARPSYSGYVDPTNSTPPCYSGYSSAGPR